MADDRGGDRPNADRPDRDAVVRSIAGRLPREDKGTPGRDEQVRASRITQAWQLRLAGLTYEQIAQQVGFNSTSACRVALHRAAERVTRETVEEFREEENARLDRLTASIWPAALTGDLLAIDRVLKIMERRARLNGLDKPVKVEVAPADRDILSWVGEMLGVTGHAQPPEMVEAGVVDGEWSDGDDPGP